MEGTTLSFESRAGIGSADCRRLRRAGKVPCILYGGGKDPVNLAVSLHELDKALHEGLRIVEMQLGNEKVVGLIKDLQYDELGSDVAHVDFMRVDRDKPVHVYVPVRFIGAAPTGAGAVVEKILEDIHVEVLPLRIPREFVVNLSVVAIGQAVTIGDLKMPEGCKPYHHHMTDIVVINHIRIEKEAAPAVEADSVEPEVIGKKPVEGAEAAPAAKAGEKKPGEKKPEKK